MTECCLQNNAALQVHSIVGLVHSVSKTARHHSVDAALLELLNSTHDNAMMVQQSSFQQQWQH